MILQILAEILTNGLNELAIACAVRRVAFCACYINLKTGLFKLNVKVFDKKKSLFYILIYI